MKNKLGFADDQITPSQLASLQAYDDADFRSRPASSVSLSSSQPNWQGRLHCIQSVDQILNKFLQWAKK
jgi:hypothetical protein